jgi:uncharacterized protein YuzE
MNITIDPRYNIAYIKFRDKISEVETLQISDELNIDISPDGKVYGLELLNANEQLQFLTTPEFVLTDISKQKSIRIPIQF